MSNHSLKELLYQTHTKIQAEHLADEAQQLQEPTSRPGPPGAALSLQQEKASAQACCHPTAVVQARRAQSPPVLPSAEGQCCLVC